MLYCEFVNLFLIGVMFEFIDFVLLVFYYLKYVINLFILFVMSVDFRNGIVVCFKGKEFLEKLNQIVLFRMMWNYVLKLEEDFDEDLDKNGEDDQL